MATQTIQTQQTPTLPTPLTDLPCLTDRKNSKINKEKAVSMYLSGAGFTEIAKVFNCAKQSVHALIRKVLPGSDGIDVRLFKRIETDALKMLGARLLYSISDEEIKKMPVIQRITGYGIMFDKIQLKEGKATQNIGISHSVTPGLLHIVSQAINPARTGMLTSSYKAEAEGKDE